MAAGFLITFGVAVITATAHEGNNHGTVKVHDDAVVDPPQQNNPHVSCDFWIEGFNMSDDTGHGEFTSIPPTSNPPVFVDDFNWSADSGNLEDGWHFLAGPFNLDPGHYRVNVFVDQGHPGNEDHQAKSKVFFVGDCPPPPCPPEFDGVSNDILCCPPDGQPGPFENGDPCAPPPECPPGLGAHAEGDGDIELTWDDVSGEDGYNIYRRAEGASGFDLIHVNAANDTDFTDTDTEVGTTYEYKVTAFAGGQESEDCDSVRATAIPFFTNAVGIALASVGGIAALTVLRRRKA